MAKRRTRRQKEKARQRIIFEPNVKRQNNIGYEARIEPLQETKRADILAQPSSTRTIRHNIIKSLILASFILSLEVVVYLAWNLRR